MSKTVIHSLFSRCTNKRFSDFILITFNDFFVKLDKIPQLGDIHRVFKCAYIFNNFLIKSLFLRDQKKFFF